MSLTFHCDICGEVWGPHDDDGGDAFCAGSRNEGTEHRRFRMVAERVEGTSSDDRFDVRVVTDSEPLRVPDRPKT